MAGASGLRWMPRKMSGREISRIDWLIVTIDHAEGGDGEGDPLVVRPTGVIRALGSRHHLLRLRHPSLLTRPTISQASKSGIAQDGARLVFSRPGG